MIIYQFHDDKFYESVEECISQAQSIMNEFKVLNKDAIKRQSWSKRMENLTSNWQSCRSQIFASVVSSMAISSRKCERCLSNAVLRCKQCCHQHLCSICDDIVHTENILHDTDLFVDGFYRPVGSTVSSDGHSLTTVGKNKYSNDFFFKGAKCSYFEEKNNVFFGFHNGCFLT